MKRFSCALTLALLLWTGPAFASSKLTICNRSESDTLKIDTLYQNNPFAPLAVAWKVYGWAEIPPGRCQPMLQHSGQLETFLSVRRKTKYSRVYVMHFPFGDKNTTAVTAERFFCVRDDPHDRVLKSLDAHEVCPAGWYAQLFNLYVKVPQNTNFTLRLGKSGSAE